MWKVRLYKSTGFNLVNVPDDPSLLEQKPHKNFGVIDCLQRYFLSYITIRAFEDDVILGDFLKLYDDENENNYAYYVVNGYTMTSGDTVQLNVAMEPLLTCGGIDNITIVDGIVTRHHLGENEPLPTEKDPLLIPKRIYVDAVASCGNGIVRNSANTEYQYKLIIRSTLDPAALTWIANQPVENVLRPVVDLEASYDAQTQTIDGYKGLFVSSPILDIQSDPDECTRIGFGKEHEGGVHQIDPTIDLSDGTFYIQVGDSVGDLDLETLTKALIKLAEYGREDVILDAYYVPQRLLDERATYASMGGIATLYGKLREGAEYVECEDAAYKILPDIGSFGPSEVHNWNAYFGDHFAYTFFSPDNNQSITINTEEFFKNGMAYDEGEPTFPEVLESCDFRPNGNMSFNIITERPIAFGLDPVPATPYNISTDSWDTAALNISAVASGAIKTKNYAMSSANKDKAVEMDIQNQIENKRRGLRAINPFNQISAGINQYYNDTSLSTQNRFANDLMTKISAEGGNEYAKARYDRMLAREQEDLEYINSMVPKVQVVSKAGGSSIMNGQGLIVFRNYIDILDLNRFDKILNKYGCKHTTDFTKDMLINRPLFNYIETQGVSIKCPTVPKSVRDELANAFNTGLRIWHVKDVDPNAWNDPVEEES